MKFALNYSEPASILLQQKKIEIDTFKAPDWPELIPVVQKQHPVYVHFSLSTCDGSIPGANWEFIETVLNTTETAHVNIHLNSPQDLNPQDPQATHQVVERMTREVLQVCRHFGPDRVVVENCPMSSPDHAYQLPAVVPETISALVQEAGCGFLLDISHARISARANQWSEIDYIQRLPLHRLRELHITGLKIYQGLLTDHFELTPEDWAVTDWAARQIQQAAWPEPLFASFEYGGLGQVFSFRNDPDVIAAQTPRLYQMFSSRITSAIKTSHA